MDIFVVNSFGSGFQVNLFVVPLMTENQLQPCNLLNANFNLVDVCFVIEYCFLLAGSFRVSIIAFTIKFEGHSTGSASIISERWSWLPSKYWTKYYR